MQVEYILDRDIYDESIMTFAKKEYVVDVGAGTPFNKRLKKYQQIFLGHYYSLDIRYHPDLDIIADAQNLPLKSSSIDSIICSDLIHLVSEPKKVVDQIHNVLKKDGIAFFSIPFLVPYHGKPNGNDYYRFTKDSIIYMLKDFRKIKIQPQGGYLEATLNFLTGFKFHYGFWEKCIEYLCKVLEKIILIFTGKKINRLLNPIGFNVFAIK